MYSHAICCARSTPLYIVPCVLLHVVPCALSPILYAVYCHMLYHGHCRLYCLLCTTAYLCHGHCYGTAQRQLDTCRQSTHNLLAKSTWLHQPILLCAVRKTCQHYFGKRQEHRLRGYYSRSSCGYLLFLQ